MELSFIDYILKYDNGNYHLSNNLSHNVSFPFLQHDLVREYDG